MSRNRYSERKRLVHLSAAKSPTTKFLDAHEDLVRLRAKLASEEMSEKRRKKLVREYNRLVTLYGESSHYRPPKFNN